MKTLYILSSLALLALGIPATTGVPTPGVGPFTNCAAEDADFNVSSTVITPAVPCIGQNICLTVSGRLGADIISGASLTIIGHSTNRLLYYDTTDVGTLLAAAGTPLPFPASAPGTNSTLTLCRPFIKSPYWNGLLPINFDFILMNANGHDAIRHAGYCQRTSIAAGTC